MSNKKKGGRTPHEMAPGSDGINVLPDAPELYFLSRRNIDRMDEKRSKIKGHGYAYEIPRSIEHDYKLREVYLNNCVKEYFECTKMIKQPIV